MSKALTNFHTQFVFSPEIVGGDSLKRASRFVIGGMGGSGHAADILRSHSPELEIYTHRNYGLPATPHTDETLYIASSYSGNTEETLDFAQSVFDKGYNFKVVSIGGKLIDFARKNNIPHIVIPDTGIQPRQALGFSIVSLVTLMGLEDELKELRLLQNTLSHSTKEEGKTLAKKLENCIPIIYTSEINRAIGNNWKIKLNESGKVPAYYDVFPELNHNEIEGYSNTTAPTNMFHFIFMADDEDHPRIQKRMKITQELYKERGLKITTLPIVGSGRFERIFNSLLLADWTAQFLAEYYAVESNEVPMVEDLKKRLGQF